jgi:hypothetical protein
MASKSRSAHQGNLYKSYKAANRYETNRKRKLTRLAKEQPNNEQIAQAMKNIHYRRKTPKAAQWSKQEKAWAQMKKDFSKPNFGSQRKMTEKEMFKLRARAHDGEGNSVWNF